MEVKKNKGILLLSILSLIATAIVYRYLPDTIAIHWNFKGEVDDYAGKWFVFITAALPIVLYTMFLVIPKIDPKRDSYEKHGKAYGIIKLITIVVLIIIHWISVFIALGYDLNIGLIVKLAVGILFIVIGNYMGQFRHNYFVGIKTPWTLANERVWKKTHRVGGFGFIVLGLVFIVGIFINSVIYSLITSVLVILLIVGLFLYSYLIYKKLQK